jgi:AcrR family transcriptional regulator
MTDSSSIDRRKVRTKAAIREALTALIIEKGFDALQVSDIAKKADINRGTFYLHYQDKFDLLERTRSEIMLDLEKILLKANSVNFSDFNSVDKPLPVVVTLFEYLQENAVLMQAIFEVQGGTIFQAQVRQVVEKNLKLGFLAGLKAENFLIPSDYVISYTISAHLGVIQTWLQKGCIETPKEMALILSQLTLYGPLHATGVSLRKFQ